ncbi:mechanosensitive ion channel family protein [Campylobacter hepaticus]|uniref:mechanosensitive ion channel family protein n=1 Tax=Campylobacter hepaticus TaxID=1813019 RepID=UPI0018CB6065|nr:mechanosensitive ion channel family protein [Campylobacter hepaticus]MCZ0771801.1 mechanosensitive ion channel family protein [Campylobacter hepaticus]MCZ0773332.1 mechanosensitive ion channel family protein [Campylobacter hepaticus]MCZ0774583.1 mechanosensitive ion channel family protein [Campylobacter hepaticus]QPM43389.1 mechanosensitive ion channel family protein [Campylobacter hepaticus]WAP49338.1 mechanosensitive ion channel family protein [Campylobacter hepaticus]
MKKIIALCFFILCLRSQEIQFIDINISKENAGIYSLVEKYIDTNNQIKEFKKNEDQNSSTFKGVLAELEKDKKNILNQIPDMIVGQKINEESVARFLKAKQKLLDTQRKNINKPYIYTDVSLNLAYFNIVQIFYSCLFEVQKLFKDTASSQDLIATIDKAMENLQMFSRINLDNFKNKINNAEELEKIALKEDYIDNALDSYSEILKYLRSNAYLLESNYLFSLLELQVWIDRINQVINISFVNVGKIAISLLVLVFFISLRRFFSNIVYFLLVQIFYKNKNNIDDIKLIFIENIKKPVGCLLLVYAASLCFTIATYPAPLSINLSNFFHIIYAILMAWLILKMLDSYGVVLVSKLAQKSGKKEVVNLVIKILYFVVVIIALLYVLAQLGFNISAIIASLGIGGLAVALAAKDIIANFFASILLLFDNSFNQGDWVEVSGVEGTVVEIGLRKTTIRTFDNSLVFLPNSTIMGANIKNWSKRRMGRHVRMYLGVGYDASPEKLEQCVKDLKEFLNTSPLVAHDEDSALKYGDHTTKYRQNLVSINDLEGYKNTCYVALSEFADSSINIELYFYTKEIGGKGFREARESLMLEFMRIIKKNDLNFAFPSRSIYIENLPPLNLEAK